MIRRRTALFVSAAVLVAAPLLSACGSTPAHPGAAAVVDGHRITVSQLQQRVQDVRDAQARSPQAAQLIRGTSQLDRSTLNGMLFEQIIERAAKDAGATVTPGEVQQTRVLFERSAGGAGRLRAMWLQQYAIGPGQIQQMVRYQLLMDKLSQQLGADRSTPGGQEKVLAALRDASASLGISVNPRYGAWDSERVVLDTVQEPWLRANPARAEQPAY